MNIRVGRSGLVWLFYLFLPLLLWSCVPPVVPPPIAGKDCYKDDNCALGSICRGGLCVSVFRPDGGIWPEQSIEMDPKENDPIREVGTKDGGCSRGEQRICSSRSVRPAGRCRNGIQHCVNGLWGRCQGETLPTLETCNGVDDDCDGEIDNQPNSTKPLQRTCQSTCGDGQESCFSGKWKHCSAALPETEICDGLDNDCDGKIDNLLIAPLCRLQKGVCKGSRRVCGGKKGWLPCQESSYFSHSKGLYQTKESLCDNLDNDCDGIKDPTPPCACKEGEVRSCFDRSVGTPGKGRCKSGKQSCSGGKWNKCIGAVYPEIEVCNDTDDDCDGLIDGLTQACKTACGKGLARCEKGRWLPCTAPSPKKEICNGKDDDCDGRIDNVEQVQEPLQRSCSTSCAKGLQLCQKGQWQRCSARLPTVEVCNGKDDDCDGRIDNQRSSLALLQQTCFSSCGKGIETCSSGSWKGCTAPAPKAEICNGKDDDCDGQTDENLKRACVGHCLEGSEFCSFGQWKGCRKTLPKIEICNGKDDNCDGRVDEDCYSLRTTKMQKGSGFLPMITPSGDYAAVLTLEGQVHYIRLKDGVSLWSHRHNGLATGVSLSLQAFRNPPSRFPPIVISGVENSQSVLWMYDQKEKKVLWKKISVSKSLSTGNVLVSPLDQSIFSSDLSASRLGRTVLGLSGGKTTVRTDWLSLVSATTGLRSCSVGRMATDGLNLILACPGFAWSSPQSKRLQPLPSLASQLKGFSFQSSFGFLSLSSLKQVVTVRSPGVPVDVTLGLFKQKKYVLSTVLGSVKAGSSSLGGILLGPWPPSFAGKLLLLPTSKGFYSRPVGIRLTPDGYVILAVQDFSTNAPYSPKGGRILILFMSDLLLGKWRVRQTISLTQQPSFLDISSTGKRVVVATTANGTFSIAVLSR